MDFNLELEGDYPRFKGVNQQDIEQLLEQKEASNTKNATKVAVDCFREFCVEVEKNADFETFEKDKLVSLLTQWYVGARNKKGELYKKSTMNAMKFGLARYFRSNCQIDIIHDMDFVKANDVFKAQNVELKRSGKAVVEHYPEIEPEDLQRIYQNLDLTKPRDLQWKVWTDIMLYWIWRGRENLREMTKRTYIIGTDSTGRGYVTQIEDELDKTHRENDGPQHTVGEGKMYECLGDVLCPVQSFETYINKLHPKCTALWQRPKLSVRNSEAIWYCNMPLGGKTLGSLMATISAEFNLSQRYTNHSLRVTAISILDGAGIQGRHIIRISGHKQEGSLKSYSRKVTNAKKREISDTIRRSLGDQEPQLPVLIPISDSSAMEPLMPVIIEVISGQPSLVPDNIVPSTTASGLPNISTMTHAVPVDAASSLGSLELQEPDVVAINNVPPVSSPHSLPPVLFFRSESPLPLGDIPAVPSSESTLSMSTIPSGAPPQLTHTTPSNPPGQVCHAESLVPAASSLRHCPTLSDLTRGPRQYSTSMNALTFSPRQDRRTSLDGPMTFNNSVVNFYVNN